jgi:putative membrane protein
MSIACVGPQLRDFLVGFVALEHLGFLVLEMFLFKGPAGRRLFRTTPEFAAQAAPLAANQGLYNGFLAAGLIWSLLAPEALAGPLRVFFLACVLVAAVFGAATVSRRILLIQGFPAAVALVAALSG